jgi:hypothetical protein
MKLMDPLGFIGPFIMKAKLLPQNLWRSGCKWDEEIDERARKFWESWLVFEDIFCHLFG